MVEMLSRLRTSLVRAGLLYAFWLLLVGGLKTPELIAGAVATAFGLAAIAAGRRHLPRYRLEPRLLGSLTSLPWELVRDSAVVFATLPRRTQGRFRSAALRVPPGERGRGLQAFAEARGTLAPNAFVVDVDADLELVLLHELDARVRGKPV